ncbi:MAG: ABC transporter permease subunit [Desulfomicrobium escambiense]|nr:ABC transporter permease subunit [Desulfomicrobium escambiense]
MRSSKLRFGWLDALILTLVFGLIGYVLHRAQSHFHYNWDWRLIPGYFARYDAEQGRWVLNLLGQGLLATVRLALWGSLLAALIGGVMGMCRVSRSLFLRLLSRTYVELIRNIPPLVFIFIFYFFISGQLMPVLDVEEPARRGRAGDLARAGVSVRSAGTVAKFPVRTDLVWRCSRAPTSPKSCAPASRRCRKGSGKRPVLWACIPVR